ncbi:AI-2E family transporter [Pararhodobacter sp.]|uniref:AI-2E family transporter n=1 Tax=Pararhodobacter sp. TaxID=2127056 RepID=UPI002AFF9455|nr:AI-2E family transporter [Pararhodobacter sp.]
MTPHEIEHAAAEPQPANRLSLVDRYRLQTWFLGIIAFSMILFLLVQARFILISLVIAIILFSLTADAITAFSRLRIGSWKITNWLASVGAFAMIAVILLTLTGIIISQINTVVTTTLGYTDQAIAAMARLAAWISPEAEQMVETSIRSIQVSTYISTLAGQASNLLSATTLVILFVGFLFAERLWFNTKLENLLHDKAQAKRVGRIIHSIVRRVNHYLLVKTGVSLATALAVYLLMEGFRLDFAGPMAILTFVLNYIPSVGSIIATILLGLVALIQVTEPATALLVFVLAGMIQFVLGSVIDPMLMGRALRVSSFGIIISLAFWGALWGIAGMFLAVPIMVAAMIVCSHIPAARPVAVLLSREGLPEIEEAGTVPDEGEPIRRAAE